MSVKTIAFAIFLALLIAGLFYGVARDHYSREQAVMEGSVTSITASTGGHKTTPPTASSLEVTLKDGRTVHVLAPLVAGLAAGSAVTISEMATPWGQVWYKLKND